MSCPFWTRGRKNDQERIWHIGRHLALLASSISKRGEGAGVKLPRQENRQPSRPVLAMCLLNALGKATDNSPSTVLQLSAGRLNEAISGL